MCFTKMKDLSDKISMKTFIRKSRLKADRDIIVYKAVNKLGSRFFSPIKNFEYHAGYHYYESPIRAINGYVYSFSGFGYFQVIRGFHSGAAIDFVRGYALVVVECIIPKGATYFFNGRLYVSDQLIFTGKKVFPKKQPKNKLNVTKTRRVKTKTAKRI